MVQNNALVRNGNPGSKDIADGPNDSRLFHVTAWIVVSTDEEDSRMMALTNHKKLMKQLEIIVVVRK